VRPAQNQRGERIKAESNRMDRISRIKAKLSRMILYFWIKA
jgi:hypothetical protein